MVRGAVVLCVVMLVLSAQPASAIPPNTTTFTETIPLSGTIIECPLEVVVALSGQTIVSVSVTTRGDPPNFDLRVTMRTHGQGIGVASQAAYNILGQDHTLLNIYPGFTQSLAIDHKLISVGLLPNATFTSHFFIHMTPGGVPTVSRDKTECRSQVR